MKRGGPIKRKKPLRSKSKPKSINKARQAKKRAKYKSYLASRIWKEKRKAALEAAGHRCEQTGYEPVPMPDGSFDGYNGSMIVRCPATKRLTVHHLRYTRFGGRELPEDLQVLCWPCHRRLHDMQGYKKRRAS